MGRDSVLLKRFNIDVRFPEKGKKYVSVGNLSMLDCTIVFESTSGNVSIGSNTFIGGSTIISSNRIDIGNNVFIAWGVYLYDHDSHSLDFRERRKDLERQMDDYKQGRNFIYSKDWSVVRSSPIMIEDDVWIGMNAVILKGVTIGKGAVVGACSVVTRNVPAWSVVAGNPAKIVKEIPKEMRY